MRKEKTRRIANEPYLQLENSLVHGDLIEVRTGKKYRKEARKKIRTNLSIYGKNHLINAFRYKLLDVAIVVYVPKWRFKLQDLDNIAKVVLDAISKDKKDLQQTYLIEDDSQVIRLLLYKKERIEHPECETSQLSISIREHDPKKEMRLVRLGVV